MLKCEFLVCSELWTQDAEVLHLAVLYYNKYHIFS